RKNSRNARAVRTHRVGRTRACYRAGGRRKRNRKGTGRTRDSRMRPEFELPLRAAQLCRPAEGTDRDRAIRLQAWRLQRGDRGISRPVSRRRSRNAFSGRDNGDESGHAGQVTILYLRGLSTGDFGPALEGLLGEDAAGLSPTNIARLTACWQQEYTAFRQRDLTGRTAHDPGTKSAAGRLERRGLRRCPCNRVDQSRSGTCPAGRPIPPRPLLSPNYLRTHDKP